MMPVPALLSIPLYDYFLIRIWLQTSHTDRSRSQRRTNHRKVTVTYPTVAFPRKVL
jgi:hypothetical protein